MANTRAIDDDFIPSLENALAVIELFTSHKPEWTLSQISRELQLTPGSTRRILRTLEVLGYATPDEGRFRLTARVLKLGFAYLASQPFAETAGPLLRDLATKLDVTCSIAVLNEREVVYVARATHRQFDPYYVTVGARMPAYATAPGKVLLAGLPHAELERRLEGWSLEPFTPNTVTMIEDLRSQVETAKVRGWATNDQEIFIGQRSLAIPLTIGGAETASLVAAASVSSVSMTRLIDDILPSLRAAADEIQQVASALL